MFLSHLLVLVLNCYLGASSARTVKRSSGPSPADPVSDVPEDQDPVSQHMLKLYERYTREHRLKDGNTVRGFRAAGQDAAEQREVYALNLTSLQDSEVVLSASFHFQLDPRPKPWACKRFRTPACRPPPAHPPSAPVNILLRAVSPGSGVGPGAPGSLLGNLTFHPHKREVWQTTDLTRVIKEAQRTGHVLLSLELDFGPHHRRQPEEALSVGGPPYLLLYADDRALAEPNSVAASLQRYDPSAEEGGGAPPRPPGWTGRARREARRPSVQDNELPAGDYRPDGRRAKESQLDGTWYLAPKAKSAPRGAEEEKKKKLERAEQAAASSPETKDERTNERAHVGPAAEHAHGKRPGSRDREGAPRGAGEDNRRPKEAREGRRPKGRAGEAAPRAPVLSFDERTMRQARRRQWATAAAAAHGGCSRKNLRVDFADIGWSEWVVAPKAFEAYYCSGTCGFPMPKATGPSNHATIQSIVRAVGISPGVPEPCCVPDQMSPLAVLYRDEARSPVLKVYPNMSVRSCSCR
ncbi:unnamed protein product [Arctogadus glacialis]